MSSFKQTLTQAFRNPQSKHFTAVNDFFAAATLISIFTLILETVVALNDYMLVFKAVEYVTVAFFTLEYLARLYIAPRRLKYMFSFFGAMDLLSVLPTYFHLANLTFLKSVRILRILRFLRMVRLAKVARLSKPADHDIEDYSYLYRLNIQIYFFALLAAVTVFGSLIYTVEASNPSFSNIPLGMLWALKVIMGGVPSTIPATVWGELIVVGARFTGLILFGLLIHVVGTVVKKWLFGSKQLF